MNANERAVLGEVVNALDVALGDSDITHLETDEEIREAAPVQWACSQLNKLLRSDHTGRPPEGCGEMRKGDGNFVERLGGEITPTGRPPKGYWDDLAVRPMPFQHCVKCFTLEDCKERGACLTGGKMPAAAAPTKAQHCAKTSTDIPCARCGGPCIEFTVPNDVWSSVVRFGGKERDDEYICEACYRKAVEAWVRAVRPHLHPRSPDKYLQNRSSEEIIEIGDDGVVRSLGRKEA